MRNPADATCRMKVRPLVKVRVRSKWFTICARDGTNRRSELSLRSPATRRIAIDRIDISAWRAKSRVPFASTFDPPAPPKSSRCGLRIERDRPRNGIHSRLWFPMSKFLRAVSQLGIPPLIETMIIYYSSIAESIAGARLINCAIANECGVRRADGLTVSWRASERAP